MKAALAASLLAGGALLFPACEDSDPTAPEGSTVIVSASPQTVQPNVDVLITATIRASTGARLPDQEVIFTTTTGILTPPAQTPLITDDDGEVTCILNTASTATVTAQSGSISQSTTVNVQACDLSQITLVIDPVNITACSTQVTLRATAFDTQAGRCGGVILSFRGDDPPAGLNLLPGTISPQQGLTDASGELTVQFTPTDTLCQDQCNLNVNPAAPNGGSCAVDFVAEDSTGIESLPVRLNESI